MTLGSSNRRLTLSKVAAGLLISAALSSNVFALAPAGTSAVIQNSTATTVDIVITGTDFATFVTSGTTTPAAGDLSKITYNGQSPSGVTVDSATQLTATFPIAMGTGKNGSLVIAAGAVQDATGTPIPNATITIVAGSITDSAKPILTGVAKSKVANQNVITFTYSEPVTVTDGASTAANGDITTAGVVAGFGTFVTSGIAGTVTATTLKNTVAGSGTNTITVTLAAQTGGALAGTVEPSGVFTPVAAAAVVDAAANRVDPVGTPTATGGGTWDLTAPVVSALAISTNGTKKIGDTVTLTITADAAGYTNSATTVNGVAVTGFTDATGGSYTATYTVASGNTDRASNATPVSVVLKDAAGNVNTAYTTVTANTVIIDANAPTNQDTVFPSAASAMGGAAVTIVSSGTASNNVWFAPSGTTTFTAGATMTTATGTATSILAPATAGTYYMFVLDAAGNISTASTAALTVDNTAPTNQDTVFPSAATAKGGAAVTIVSSGTASNNVWFAPAGTTTFTAGATMTKAASGTATSILAPATAGTYKLFVLDAAGNISTASTAALTVDNTAPTVTATLAQNSATTFTITFSETIDTTTSQTTTNYTLSGTGGLTGNPSAAVKTGATVLLTVPTTAGFTIGQTLIVTPSTSITDVAGNALTAGTATYTRAATNTISGLTAGSWNMASVGNGVIGDLSALTGVTAAYSWNATTGAYSLNPSSVTAAQGFWVKPTGTSISVPVSASTAADEANVAAEQAAWKALPNKTWHLVGVPVATAWTDVVSNAAITPAGCILNSRMYFYNPALNNWNSTTNIPAGSAMWLYHVCY